MNGTLGEAMHEIAFGELGRGEQKRNNDGFHIRKYRMGRRPLGSGSWCATFLYWCYVQACWARYSQPKVKRTNSARRLALRLTEIGTIVKYPRKGDIVWFERPGVGTHIAICHDADAFHFRTIDGNKGKFPADVSLHTHHHRDPNIKRVIRLG